MGLGDGSGEYNSSAKTKKSPYVSLANSIIPSILKFNFSYYNTLSEEDFHIRLKKDAIDK